jgi:hypothetical protein
VTCRLIGYSDDGEYSQDDLASLVGHINEKRPRLKAVFNLMRYGILKMDVSLRKVPILAVLNLLHI